MPRVSSRKQKQAKIISVLQSKKTQKNMSDNIFFRMTVPEQEDYAVIKFQYASQKYPQEVIKFLAQRVKLIPPQDVQEKEDQIFHQNSVDLHSNNKQNQQEMLRRSRRISKPPKNGKQGFNREKSSQFPLCSEQEQKNEEHHIVLKPMIDVDTDINNEESQNEDTKTHTHNQKYQPVYFKLNFGKKDNKRKKSKKSSLD